MIIWSYAQSVGWSSSDVLSETKGWAWISLWCIGLTYVLYIFCLGRKGWDNNWLDQNSVINLLNLQDEVGKQTFELALVLPSTEHPALLPWLGLPKTVHPTIFCGAPTVVRVRAEGWNKVWNIMKSASCDRGKDNRPSFESTARPIGQKCKAPK